MGKVSDDDTRVVLRKLACCFPAFYALYYGVAAILCAAFGLFDASPQVFGKMPFDFEAFGDFSFGEKPKLGACTPPWRPPLRAPRAAHSAPSPETRRVIAALVIAANGPPCAQPPGWRW